MHTQLTTIRVFIKWCEDMSLLPVGTHESIRVPQLNGEDRRTRRLDSEVAKHILEYLDRYQYAHRDHVIMRLLWRAALRVGSLHSLDVDDYYADVKQLEIAHRPDEGTPIKKAHNGERRISLNDKTCAVIEDYVENRRYDVTDEYQRKPLLTSKHGRLTISSIRRAVYKWTQPCQYTGDCPHGRVLSECDAKGYTSTTGCPSSLSPHDIRRGAITNFLADDIPKEIVQDRCDVTSDVIDDHYDTRSESEKAEQRRKYIK